MLAAGLDVSVDAMFNVRGSIGNCDGRYTQQENLFVGSHYDTVVDAGKFDGALGIVAGISAVKALILDALITGNAFSGNDLKKKFLAGKDGESTIIDLRTMYTGALQSISIAPPNTCLQVVAFSDEEGARFKSTFLGSRALAGTLLDPNAQDIFNVLNARDADGITLEEALLAGSKRLNLDTETLYCNLKHASMSYKANHTMKAYVEVHLEQGPVLESKGQPLGVVSHIAGQVRAVIRVNGTQGHAGTVPMGNRKDALAGAAHIITAIERLCQQSGLPAWLVCTVGSMDIRPGAINVIPGQVGLYVDVRSSNDTLLEQTMMRIDAIVSDDVCHQRGLGCSIEVLHQTGTVECDPALTHQLQLAVDSVIAASTSTSTMFPPPFCTSYREVCPVATATSYNSYVHKNRNVTIVSGAGHDAVAMANAGPVGMIFVRCRGGISHSPEEFVSKSDVGLATSALFYFLKQNVVAYF